MNALLDLLAVAFVIAATALIGIYGLRVSRTTSGSRRGGRPQPIPREAGGGRAQPIPRATSASSTRAALRVATSGRWLPVASANPATVPVTSATAVGVTAEGSGAASMRPAAS